MAPVLYTERLELRLVDENDLPAIHALLSIPEVDRYNTFGIPEDIQETKTKLKPFFEANLNGTQFTYGVFLENRLIGLVGIVPNKPKYRSVEIWFKYFPDFWGRGYATEVLKRLINYCFDEMNLHRVEAGCAVDNIGSKRVMEKVGMQLEGRRRQTLCLSAGWSDNFEFAILSSDPRDY